MRASQEETEEGNGHSRHNAGDLLNNLKKTLSISELRSSNTGSRSNQVLPAVFKRKTLIHNEEDHETLKINRCANSIETHEPKSTHDKTETMIKPALGTALTR